MVHTAAPRSPPGLWRGSYLCFWSMYVIVTAGGSWMTVFLTGSEHPSSVFCALTFQAERNIPVNLAFIFLLFVYFLFFMMLVPNDLLNHSLGFICDASVQLPTVSCQRHRTFFLFPIWLCKTPLGGVFLWESLRWWIETCWRKHSTVCGWKMQCRIYLAVHLIPALSPDL